MHLCMGYASSETITHENTQHFYIHVRQEWLHFQRYVGVVLVLGCHHKFLSTVAADC